MKFIFLFITFLLSTLSFSQDKRPNIILIMSDDQGWFDTGFNGNTVIKTPHLDALAKEGVIFNRFYSASAVCSPTRASVITGRNPYRINIPSANRGHMKKEEITLAELLKKKGYVPGHYGKWHLGTLTKKELDANRGGKPQFEQDFSIPTMHGYDTFFCTESKVPTYDPLIFPATFKKGESKRYGWTAIEQGEASKSYETHYWIGNEKKAKGDLKGDDTKIVMDQVIPFIQKAVKKDKPFFTTLWPHTPHLPVVTSKEYRKLYKGHNLKEQLYMGCISAMDEQIGRLWNELKQLGIDKNTMIWFCSDNGPSPHSPGKTGGLRGGKRNLYEGGLRTPAFLVWKNHVKADQQTDFPAYTSDYLPTILSALDIKYPSNRPLDGIDILPFIEQPSAKREKPMGFRFRKQISWVNQQYKLISTDNGETYELYDLLNDREEKKNIIASKPNVAEVLKSELNIWKASVKKSAQGKDY